jgi:hypothetical protein
MIDLLNPHTFHSDQTRSWMSQHWQWSVHLSFLYFLMIFLGQLYMKHKQPFHLQTPLVAWNAFLAVFSICGTISMFPEFINTLNQRGFDDSICKIGSSYNGWSGYWLWLFVLSKTLELGDTAFLVLRKRPVIFLHWFHHSSVLVYAFYGYQYAAPNTRWGAVMNFTVHSVMYGYYALRAAHVRVPRRVAMCVTVMQIVQMAVGSFICFSVFYKVVWLNLPHAVCEMPVRVSVFQTLLYFAYFYLFMEFFYNAYVKKGGKGAKES